MEAKNEWRITVTIPEELEERIVKLRQDERYTRLSFGEIIRQLIQAGLDAMKEDEA